MTAPSESMPALVPEERILLRDGGTIHVRSVTAEDRDAVAAFFSELSPESQRLRFFGARPSLPATDLDRITSQDPHRTIALEATESEGDCTRIVGVAELAAMPSSETGTSPEPRAEFAVAVADAHQGRGIGTVLLERVAAAARAMGIEKMVAYVLRDNHSMLDVLAHVGLQASDRDENGRHVFVISSAATPAFDLAHRHREDCSRRHLEDHQ